MAELAEGARLEIVFRFTPDQGSNPCLSATKPLVYESTEKVRLFSSNRTFIHIHCIIINIKQKGI